MKIENIFAKDLFRPINGVVKADQKDEAVVWQELDEYVITKELDRHFRRFFQAYLDAMDNPRDPVLSSRMGVWVSGFFGSGKSHFIKILSYILANHQAHNPTGGVSRKAIDFFDPKVDDAMLLADIKRGVSPDADVILFNIDSKADSKEGRDAILQVFLKVFNEMQGFCGEAPHIAEMERYLAGKGVLETFHQAFTEIHGGDWRKERDAFAFMQDEIVEALSRALGMSREAAGVWFDKAEEQFTISIEKFSKMVKDYLETKGPNHRIIFLVDEIGQFIGGDTHLMLNLQTITEDLGRLCNGRAWVIVTSQEDIDAVLGEFRNAKAQDFSKIQGRFNTRLSLSSSNTDEVIQRRLLAKTEDAKRALEDLWLEKGEILKNQISFVGGKALKNNQNKDGFVSNYPFAPYQFELLQKVFESIRKAGATGVHLAMGERSMLDAFQSAAKSIAGHGLGSLVPLYAFYPAIESFLDTSVKRTVDQATEDPSLEPFDVQLLRALFLIRYVDIIRPSIDNLVTLCIDQVDTDRLALKRKIEESLTRLEKQTLINRNGDLFFFLTNEERDVSKEIKNVELGSGEDIKFLSDLIFDEVLKGDNKHRYQLNKRDYGFNRVCDGRYHGGKVDQELSIEIVSPLHDEYELFGQAKCIGQSTEGGGRVLFKLGNRKELSEEIKTYLKSEKYIRRKNDASAPTTLKRILGERAEENRERKNRLVALLEQMLVEADCFALGQSILTKTSQPRTAVAEALIYLIENIYTKLGYLKGLQDDPQKEIRATLMADDIGQQGFELEGTESNTQAYNEIRQYVDLCAGKNQKIYLNELAERFTKRPYGWPDWEVVLLVARLFMAGEALLKVDGGAILPREAIDYLTKSVKWKQVALLKRKATGIEDLKKARRLGQDVFGQIGPETEEGLFKFLVQQLSAWEQSLRKYEPLAQTGRYPGKKLIDDATQKICRLTAIHDSYEYFQAFNKAADDLHDLAEDVHLLQDFYGKQRSTWERLQTQFTAFKVNRDDLDKDPAAQKALVRMGEILAAPSPYGMLQETDKLIEAVQSVNDRLIGEKRSYVLDRVEQGISHIHEVLEEYKAAAELSNQSLLPLQTIKKKIQSETSIPGIFYQEKQVSDAVEEAIARIEEQLAAKAKEKEKDSGGPPPKPPKPVKYVHASKCASKLYLENREDVDAYLEKLKKELLAALEQNARIRIQ